MFDLPPECTSDGVILNVYCVNACAAAYACPAGMPVYGPSAPSAFLRLRTHDHLRISWNPIVIGDVVLVESDMSRTKPVVRKAAGTFHNATFLFTNEDRKISIQEARNNATDLATEIGVTWSGSGLHNLLKCALPYAANAQRVMRGGPRCWLIDTGAGYDLLSRSEAGEFCIRYAVKTPRAITLRTASGITNTTEYLPIQVSPLGEVAKPLLLESTPAVLSVGYRCMKKGYSFWWPAGQAPYLILLNGKRIELRVDDFVPFFDCQDPYATLASAGLTQDVGDGHCRQSVDICDLPGC